MREKNKDSFQAIKIQKYSETEDQRCFWISHHKLSSLFNALWHMDTSEKNADLKINELSMPWLNQDLCGPNNEKVEAA